MNKTPNEYPTTDLQLAAYLKTVGIRFREIRGNGRQKTFVFDYDPEIERHRNEYTARTGMVPALTFMDEMRALKALLYEVK